MTHYRFAADPYEGCWLAGLPDAGDCQGQLQRCHLISKQHIRREIWQSRRWKASGKLDGLTLHDLQADPRTWVPGCQRHHFLLDEAFKLQIPRYLLPPAVEEYAAQWGLVWLLDRLYGERLDVAA